MQIRCPACHLSTYRKSALIQKPSEQVPKAFHWRGIAEKAKNILETSTLSFWILEGTRIFFVTISILVLTITIYIFIISLTIIHVIIIIIIITAIMSQ